MKHDRALSCVRVSFVQSLTNKKRLATAVDFERRAGPVIHRAGLDTVRARIQRSRRIKLFAKREAAFGKKK